MINSIKVTSLNESTSNEFLRKNQINFIISIIDKHFFDELYKIRKYNSNILWKYFIFGDEETDITAFDAPKKKDIERLIELFNELINSPDSINLLIHCYAGISRSTAAAFILLYMIHKDYDIALNKLKIIRSQANPNLLMLKWADEILGTTLHDVILNWRNWRTSSGGIWICGN